MKLKHACAILAALLPAAVIQAQDTPRSEPIYCSSMMTPQERDEHRARMRDAKSAEEREKVRAEHHAQMTQRGKERGLTMPDHPAHGAKCPGAGTPHGAGMMGHGGMMGHSGGMHRGK